MNQRITRTLAATAVIALLGAAHNAHAQWWTYSSSPVPIIQHYPSGWTFLVARNGNNLTVTDCIWGWVGTVPLGDAVSGGYQIVSITSPSLRTGGVLGSWHSQATSLTLPSSLTSIGDCAFSYCTALTGSLTIPDSVTRIGDHAFYSCTGFTGPLTIGNSVTSIGSSAFDFCTRFTGPLIIPDSVTYIGGYAFYGTSFQQITTPSTGVTFETLAFARNPALTNVTFTGECPASVGIYIYYNSPAVTSYVFSVNAPL